MKKAPTKAAADLVPGDMWKDGTDVYTMIRSEPSHNSSMVRIIACRSGVPGPTTIDFYRVNFVTIADTPRPLTKKEMFDQIHALGLTCRVRDGEIRVNFSRGREATAYYTDDRQDAVDTAKAMIAHVASQVVQPST